jgi:hypothetical protein
MAIYSITIGLKPTVAFVVVDSAGVCEWAFATWVPANAKKRKLIIVRTQSRCAFLQRTHSVVPTHSPTDATNIFLTSLFIHIVHGRPK